MTKAVEGSESATEQSLRERYSISDEPEGQEPEGSEPAPASEPVEEPQERKPLTDEEKSERKRRSDDRRERRFWEREGEYKARIRHLEEDNERLRSTADQKRESAPAATDEPDFEKILDRHLNSGKFDKYEKALAAANKEYADARETRFRERFEQENSSKAAERTVAEHRSTYEKDAREFAKTHEDYDDVYADVASALDTRDAKGKVIGNAATRAILTSKNPAALIYHIGSTPELLAELQDLVESDEEAAAVRIGEIRASLRKDAPPVEDKKPPTGASRGRSTTRISGRGGGGNSKEEQRQHAAEKGDFGAFSAANGSKRNW